MATTLTSLLGLSTTNAVPAAAGFLSWNFVYAYAILSTRFQKNLYGIDHNECPREDLDKYGDAAVKSGKITVKQLAKMRRTQAAHENAVEGYPLFVAAVLFALQTKVDPARINHAMAVYTFARLVFGINYIYTESKSWSWIRTVSWWTGNITCFTLFYHGSKVGSI